MSKIAGFCKSLKIQIAGFWKSFQISTKHNSKNINEEHCYKIDVTGRPRTILVYK